MTVRSMNYKESKKILAEIKKAEKILVNCHKSPDPDSVGSAISLYAVLKTLGKEVEIICPSNLPNSLQFLPFSEQVIRVDFEKFNFSDYDLFVVLDSGGWNMVVGDASIPQPNIPIISIDHHKTKEKFGTINLIDSEISSTAEILFLLFKDWKVEINKNTAIALLTGIIGDTGVFRFPGVTSQTLEVAKDLMEKGADKDEAIFNVYGSLSFNLVKFWGEVLNRMEFDEEYEFVWSAVPFEVYKEYSHPEGAKETAATMFARIVEDTDFGIVMVERKEKILSISFRSRTDFDVSEIAVALGGGGHKAAAAAEIKGLEFDKAVKKALRVARKFAKQE